MIEPTKSLGGIPIDASRHARLGASAVARGWITPEIYGEVLLAVADSGVLRTAEEVWVMPGHLTDAQLATLSVALAETIASAGPMTVPILRGRRATESRTSSGEAPAPTAADAADQRYARLRTAGQGGMGIVYECLDQRLGRRVAVKALRKELWEGGAAATMLEREARITGSLEHPNIMPVHDMARDELIGPYYVMRYADLPTLALILEGVERGGSEWGTGRLLRAFIQVCHAADYAHSRGIVHCDLKPSNILLGVYGEVLVLDWGMSFKPAEGTPFRGGTVGYMAPEQASGVKPIDARTDVYGLGAILYQLLSLRCPFDEAPSAEPDAPPLRAPRPSQIAPTRDIAPELEEICLRALEPDAELRWPSARALATAIEDFLEGTQEKARAQVRADDLCEQARMLEENFDDFLRSRDEQLADLTTQRRSIASWEPAEKKTTLWDAEERLHVMDALSMRMLNGAVAAYERALEEVPGHHEARRGLARLFLGEARRAEARRDQLSHVYFEDLARQYGDQATATALDADGFARVTAPAGTTIELAGVRERARRLAVDPDPRRVEPGAATALAPGLYLAVARGPGETQARLPFVVRAGQPIELHLDPGLSAALKPGEILIPAGPGLLDVDGGPGREVQSPAFIIDELPVSVAEYLEFLAERAAVDPLYAGSLVPRGGSGAPLWRVDGATVVPLGALEFGSAAELGRLPVFGVDAISAAEFARWRSTRTGLSYRLPTEAEWERAGRGADGRIYPWGNHFDASFCKMRESRPGLPHPEARGAFVDDVSPFGVRDLAGGVAEWAYVGEKALEAVSPDSRMVSRGGAWCDWSADCSLAARRVYLAVERSPRVGFRLMRPLPR